MFFSFDPGALTWSNQNITTSFISFKHRFPNWHLTHYKLGNQNFFLYPPCMVTKITAAIEILSLHICLTVSSLRRISHGFIICKLCIQYIHSCKYARKEEESWKKHQFSRKIILSHNLKWFVEPKVWTSNDRRKFDPISMHES